MGSSNNKELSKEELLKIYINHQIPAKNIKKSAKYVPLELEKNEKIFCCFPRNRQYKWRIFFSKECGKLSKKYEWPKILTNQLKIFRPEDEKKYQIDLKWVKISLYDHEVLHNFNEARISQEIPKYSKTNSINYEPDKIPFITRRMSIDNIPIDKNGNASNSDSSQLKDAKKISELIKKSLTLEEKEIIPYLENTSHFTHFETEKHINRKKKDYNHFTFINSINIKNNESFINEEDNEANELIRAIIHYKLLCQTIEKHLNDKENILCCIKEKYLEYFSNKYEDMIKNKEIFYYNRNSYVQLVETAYEDLKEFIRVFHQSIYFFYKINYLDKKVQIEKSFFKPENIHNFLTSILLDKKIYSILYLSSMQMKENEEILLKKSLEFCYRFTPKEYDINKKYWLNEETIRFLTDNADPKSNSHKDSDLNRVGPYLSFHHHDSDAIEKIEEENENPNKIPYFQAIEALREFDFFQSPLHKLKILVKVGDLIIQCIEDFYQKNGFSYIKNSVNADDFLPLFIYVIVKSKVKYFYTHIKIIDELASRNLKNTLSGYYFVTLQIALGIIVNMYNDSQRPEKPSFTENLGARISEITNPKNRTSYFFWR